MNNPNESSSALPEEELFVAIETLVQAEQKLVELTGGEVDAVVGRDGKTYVLRQAQEELRRAGDLASEQSRSREQLHTLALSSMSDFAQIFDQNGRILFVNQSLLNLWEKRLEDVLGKNFFDLDYPTHLAEKLQGQLAQVVETGQPVKDEFLYTGPKGTEGLYEYIFSPVYGALGEVELVVGATRDISERKLAENKLHRHGAELQVLFDLIPAMLCIKDTQNRFLHVNQRLAESIGLTVSEFEGKTAEELFPLEAAKYLADDLEVIRAGTPKLEIVEQLRTLEGEERWVQTDKVPFRDQEGEIIGLVVMSQDITDRRRAEVGLRESEERLRLALEASGNGMFDYDLESNRMVWSPGHEALWGYSESEFDGTIESFTRRVHPEDLESLIRAMERSIEAQRPFDNEFRIVWPDGSIRWIRGQGRYTFDSQGRPQRMGGIVKEITDRKQTEMALLRMNEELEARVAERTSDLAGAKEEADRANKAKSEFLSRMSHELRTPLNAVLGYAQLLDLQFEDPKIREATRSILKGGEHLLQLINEVLDLSRIESGIFAISIEPVSVEGAIDDAIGMVQPLAERAGIQITVDKSEGMDLHLQADRQRLVQVLVNLLGNGIKYNRLDGHVMVRFQPVDETLGRIEVVDSGFGIEPDDQKRLFEPFQRFGDHQVEGTGLGLALSERFIKLMGGRLGLAESSKTGSTFFIELDRSAPHTKEFEAASAGDSLPESLATCAGTVLYVEDNPANLRLLEIVFGEAPNLKLLSAGDGARGIELAIDKQPDIILLDLHLPDVNGDEVLQQLKAEPKTQSIPVVMISADATPKQRRALRAAGAVEYLTKPLNLKLLFSVLAEYLAE